jgi:hypothetical protein
MMIEYNKTKYEYNETGYNNLLIKILEDILIYLRENNFILKLLNNINEKLEINKINSLRL